MAKAINELAQLELSEQIEVLSSLSNNKTIIEIDGIMYPIQQKVFDLIESLNSELLELKEQPFGLSENKEG
jgi:hypothetical protein|tara:strand:+ start:745 stop:957 length:213 start_codon:yes stop_codon:yes gene_type:complete